MDLSVLPPPPRFDDLPCVPTLDPVLREFASRPSTPVLHDYEVVPPTPALPDLRRSSTPDPLLEELASSPPPPALPPPPANEAVEAYLESDTVLLTPHLRVSLRGYNRADVEHALDGMRKRIVMMRADLERAQSAQKAADEIVTQARLTAAEMLADASIEANRMLDEATTTSQDLLDDTQRRCQRAARRGISAAFEMAGMLGYTDTRRERFDDDAEQEAFEDFFEGDKTSTDRAWMAAS